MNISDLITVSDVMTHLMLGPNGSLIYCMEYLEKNLDWLRQSLAPLKDKYLIFDFPGQVRHPLSTARHTWKCLWANKTVWYHSKTSTLFELISKL